MLLSDRKEYNEYAPVPFWSWNNRLDKAEIAKQVRQMYEAGYGGFVIHARAGLDTPYLSEEWFECVETALHSAKQWNMKIWLYDEFGFPSGLAGGINLQEPSRRAQYLEYTAGPSFEQEAFAVFIIKDGEYKRVERDEGAHEYHCIFLRTSESEVDPCNRAVAQALIESTHEKYYARFQEYFGKTVLGFFTDEPQYYRYATPYTKELEKTLGDMRDNLIWLFKQDESGYAFRVQYYTQLNKLYTENYYKVVYEWCEKHNCALTGHTVEEPHLFTQMWCCGGAMPSYEYCQVPGIDHLCRHTDGMIEMKQVASVSAQLGKSCVMTESFGCSGLDIDPRRLRFLAERQYVNGVNYMVQHLCNYSIQGQGITDNPPDFSPHTPWWEDISVFNEYFAKLGYILRNTKEQVNTLVIHPMQSAYLTYLRKEDAESVKALDEELTKLTNTLAFNGVRFHFGDEGILSRWARAENGKIAVGERAYDFVIMPYTQSISETTYVLLSKFQNCGGKLCLYSEFPQYIFGKRTALPPLQTNCSLEEIFATQSCKLQYLQGDKVVSRHCNGDCGEYLYLVNFDEHNPAKVQFADMDSFVEYDIRSEETTRLEREIYLAPCQSVLLKKGKSTNERALFLEKENITSAFAVKGYTENALMLDFVSYSKDGKRFTKRVFYSKMIDELILEGYAGDLFVRYDFNTEISGDFTLVTGNNRIKFVKLDGKKLTLTKSDYDILYQESVLQGVEKGAHSIEFCIDFYQDPSVRHIVFDEGVTESLKNCLVYATTVEPIYIKGNFAVFKEGVICAPTAICGVDNLQDKGLLFFAGKVKIEGEIELTKRECAVSLLGEYMSARVCVNGRFVDTAVLNETVDISRYTKIGKNKIEIELTSSLRNAYGPHHVRGLGEIYGIIPRMFTFRGCWQGDNAVLFGQSYFAPDYEFVPFGLNEIILYK